MIEAKNMAKAMKSAAKALGFKIYHPNDGSNLYIWNDIWCVVLKTDKVPRLVLEQIVEATGELPKPGFCGIVTTQGLQTLHPDVAEKEIQYRTATNPSKEISVSLAPIRYRGMIVYQAATLEVYATNGAGISIAERSAVTSATVEGGKLFFTAAGECLILQCSRPVESLGRPEEELPVWAALESCALGKVE